MTLASAYPNYRQPKMRWLPAVPEHWNEQRAKTFFREVDERSKTGQEELLSVSHLTGVTPRSQKNVTMFKAASYVGSKLCRPGDIVINTLWAWMAALGSSRHVGIVSPAYGVYRPHNTDSFNPTYLDYLLRTRAYVAEYIGRSTGIRASRLRLYPNQFLDIALIQPPRPEQDQIVAYLRAQDAHIARLIKAKRDLIKLLTEQKLRIIDHAVTRGLDASVALKPSSIDWLGEVPGHWELRRLKFLASNTTNQTTTKASDEIYLALEHVQSWTGVARPLEGEVEFASTVKRFVADDVLFGKLRPYLAKVTRAHRAGVCVSEFLVLRARKELILSAYLEQLLRCKRVIDLINSSTAGAKMPRADWTFIGNVRLPIPRKDEQEAILSHILRETKDLDEAIARAEDEIKLIREYRDRLIADVVTGQVDVRGWQPDPDDVVDDAALDVAQLLAFLQATQPKVVDTLELAADGIKRTQFLHRLQGEITKRGVVDVLRKGVSHGPVHVDLYKLLPTPGNATAADAFGKNIFSVTRQVRYSNDSGNELDLAVFINGLPVLTFELKNSLTKQTLADAIVQYQTTRSPQELLFQLGRCVAHVAVDDAEAAFCTELKGKASWFLPFNQGWNSGAGNPPNPDGLKTDYLWKQVLTRESLANIIESYAQVVEEEEADASGKKRKKRKQIFPRFHQLRTVRALLRRAHADGVGKRYLIQHSAGSGKSNTIAWLAHQLVELRRKDDPMTAQFDSIIVITDRRALDTQIARTIKGYDHVAAIFGHSDNAQELREYLRRGKKIIVTTVQKFPFILDELGDLSDRKFALLIDEAHSSQGGKTTARMHEALGGKVAEEEFEEDSTQDAVNAEIEKRIASRKLLVNASYFAFTATPKNKTLELFGEKTLVGDKVQFRSPEELTYTTKQAIQEKFILDVVENYTTYDSFYQVAKTVADDPEFDKVKALKKIRHYVESHDKAIRRKAEIMVDHFIAQVAGKQKIGGKARAMIVCNGIARAIDYWREVSDYLTQIKSPYKAIVAYSGDFEIGGQKKTEADLNGFPSKDIPANLKQDPYRFLIVANKFVTGFDEPLLHTMYVDKPLAGVLAVQTLSRLNRAHPQKHDTFVLDFADNAEAVKAAFQDYYRATIQTGETDANKLHDLKAELDGQQVYSWQQVEELVALYLSGADRDKLDPILDACVAEYTDKLGEDDQVKFKGKAKAFVRSYGFLAAILSYGHPTWEKLSIFLNFLIPKLPAPKEEDLSKGVLETIDMDSYRVEAKAALKMAMADADATVDPVPPGGGGGKGEADIDKLSAIIKTFNDLFGNIEWKDEDKIRKVIAEEIPARVAQDKAYQNAQANSDKQNAKLEHDKALNRVVLELLSDHTELFKQFSDNSNFKRWLTDTVFDATYQRGVVPPKAPPQTGASA